MGTLAEATSLAAGTDAGTDADTRSTYLLLKFVTRLPCDWQSTRSRFRNLASRSHSLINGSFAGDNVDT